MNNLTTLRLFNAIQVEQKTQTDNLHLDVTIKNGYVLSPEVAAVATDSLIREINSVIGLSGTKANASFHKSWEKIRTATDQQLFMEQLIHYFTTYGLEALGLYSESTIFIPDEALNIPAPKMIGGVRLVVVKGLTREEIFDRLAVLVGGVALSNDVLNDIMEIERANGYGQKLLDKTKNRELRTRLYDFHDLVPSDPEEFLKYVIYKLTGETLVIKNPNLIKKIRESVHGRWMDSVAIPKAPLRGLSAIFHRYKPLLLAMKSISRYKRVFNQMRRDAERYHIPMQPSYLNTVTERIKKGKGLYELEDQLGKVNIWRKIRLAQALSYRTDPGRSIVYRIRNGKGYVADFRFDQDTEALEALDTVLRSICKGLNVSGQTIYIPNSVELAIPATEKQFVGNIPAGSYIKTSEDMIAGVNWHNVNGHRIDLDLSSMDISGQKVGWDADYRRHGTMFSGDMTDASGKNGATELLYFPNKNMGAQLLSVNYFNHREGVPVPMSILVAHATSQPRGFTDRKSQLDYMVDPNNVLVVAKSTVSEQQTILGLVMHVNGENRFYFVNTTMGKSRSIRQGKYVKQTQQFFMDSLEHVISLRSVLRLAGAKVVDSRPEMGEYTDLSPEALDKGTLIQLLTK